MVHCKVEESIIPKLKTYTVQNKTMSADNNPFSFELRIVEKEVAEIKLLYHDELIFVSRNELSQCVENLAGCRIKFLNYKYKGEWNYTLKLLLDPNSDYENERNIQINREDIKLPLVTYYYEKLTKLLKYFSVECKTYNIDLKTGAKLTFFEHKKGSEWRKIGMIKEIADFDDPDDFHYHSTIKQFCAAALSSKSFGTTSTTFGIREKRHTVKLFITGSYEDQYLTDSSRGCSEEEKDHIVDTIKKHKEHLHKFFGIADETIIKF